MIDLHIHSTASDGSFSPLEIMTLAKETGVRAISITDHDTLDGIKEIQKHPLFVCPEFIAGVEISCEPPTEFKYLGSIHLLGYGFSVYDKNLNAILDEAKKARAQRNPEIIKRLNSLGFDITIEQVEQHFGATQTGRPHIAELMKELGYVKTFKEAFDKYLGKDKPAYVDKYKVSCQKAIQTIQQAGGISVLAHPGLLTFNKTHQMETFIDVLISYGLEGIEVYYTDHDAAMTSYYQRLAIQKNLMMTGGSDFHGDFNDGVRIGTGKDNLNIGYSLFKALTVRLESIKEEYAKEKHTLVSILEKNIGYVFKDISFLNTALCHRSYLNENQDSCTGDNERLEFLGDAVLGLCIGQLLMEKSPSKKEGELSKLRSNLVSEPALADMARCIDLGRFIRLGKGEALSRGFDKNSILSDAFEAVIAAVYLDGGFDTAYRLIHDLFSDSLDELLSNEKIIDYKSLLQEFSQEHGGITPQYVVINETGPDHDKTFEISLNLFGIKSKGLGKTKKAAEQDCAKKALKMLKKIHF
ncbi:ribonuclease III [Desulfobacula toluolica]|uniref:Ribonuclease 3 n=1 Tax=Desulfobacula toluolica (strain DSM 7467 / Tol2) TaxID=651182 RepID=K0NJK3_DESTT|nr:ribonuclease III [Desulfobacula toluolica]CCK79037.1 Rnc: ribonuclease III [Desulfobacula toluolica Tol2]